MEKIACKICGKKFKRVCFHARQKHEISSREYKENFGYDVRKGILIESDREHMRNLAYENGMPERLQKAGEKTRFKKNQKGLGKYSRSEQTLKRLKIQGRSLPHNNIPRERFEKICQLCGNKFEVIKSRLNAKFCSRHCSTINRNKMQVINHFNPQI